MQLFRRGIVVLGFLVLLLMPSVAAAAGSKTGGAAQQSGSGSKDSGATTQSVTQGYAADPSVQKGMIVMLDDKNSSKVDALTSDKVEQMLGVAVAANDATVTLSDESNTGQVFVASFGRYDVLVSNQNGPIKAGDYITISALAGVGMKVDTTQPVVLGRAAAAFTGSGNVDGSAKLKASDGSTVPVSIGRIPVDISISHNPLQQSVAKGVPGFLQKAAEQVAGKQVAASRIYLGMVVLMAATIVTIGVLYSGIRGGLISIGRNPLAKKSIFGGIARVVLSGLIIFIIGIFGVYLILRL